MAVAAGPPSPEKPKAPVPAMVVMLAVGVPAWLSTGGISTVTRRILCPKVSAT